MAERNTPMLPGELISLDVAASTKIEAGKMVAKNSAGYAVEAADAASLVVIGRAEDTKDNTTGANGDLTINVRRKNVFRFNNSATNAATRANIGSDLYVEDDETVSTSGGTNSIVAGKCLGVDTAGVWVEIS